MRRRGFALITVLISIAILTAVVVEMQYSASLNAEITMHARDRIKAYYLAESGLLLSQLRLQADTQMDRLMGMGEIDHLDESIWAVPLVLPMPKSMIDAEVEKGKISRLLADQLLKVQDLGGTISAEITDESGKINLNDLRTYTNRTTNYTYKVLLALLSQEEFAPFFERQNREEFIYNLVDWIDEDNIQTAFGGGMEDSWYQNKNLKGGAKNLPFFTVAEMKMVREVDPKLYLKLIPYVTVYPYNIRLIRQESGRINVNTAPKQVLAALLSMDAQEPKKTLALAQIILEYRAKTGPFKSGTDFAERLEKDLAVPPTALDMRNASQKLAGSSDLFRISASGLVGNSETAIEAVVQRNRAQGTFNIHYYQVR